MTSFRYERPQYVEIRNAREAGSTREDLSGKSVGEIYGAEHLCRLIGLSRANDFITFLTSLVTLPELICQTNMDQQSVNKLKEELTKFTNWLVKDEHRHYFAKEYETQSQEYIDLARHSV